METIRCTECNKKLAEAEYLSLSIKCPRCGHLNNLKAGEPRHLEDRHVKAQPNRPVDRRQAPPG
ncbi:Com family DNA-binding transcriptional regulator [Azonexus sp.]|uniref:Com family DNA-binding transcriptional regulator n=1 Tax=Azonexus sp. TaxID=1872668 RepID=UPI0035A0A0E6